MDRQVFDARRQVGRVHRQGETQLGGPFGEFKGSGLTGYDNVQKKYNGMWIDSMSTSISTSLGTADKDGKVFTFTKECHDPISGKPVKSRDVLRIVSDDEHVINTYTVGPDGKETKAMEIIFKRVKK